MRKLSKKEILIGSSLLFGGSLIFGVFPSIFGFQLKSDQFVDNAKINEIETVYLKLFSEFKESKLTSVKYIPADSKSVNDLKRDPFNFPEYKKNKNRVKQKIKKPPIKKSPVKNQFILNGILWDKNSPSAIIDRKVVNIGSYIGSFKVLQISPQQVILVSQDEKLVLQMTPKRKSVP